MRLNLAMLGTALCVAALVTACDRGDRGPVKSALQQPAPSQGPRTDVGQLPSQQPAQSGTAKESQPPIQGQADVRESNQKQHFDNKR